MNKLDLGATWAENVMILGPAGVRQTGIEAGFFSGYWSYDAAAGFFQNLVPYWTINNGDGSGQGYDPNYTFYANTSLGM